jgi:endonuclease/exonuclease/phosphatase family metal-dependent hydrolase
MAARFVGLVAAILGLALAPADDAPTDVRVMSFNIRYGTARDGENHWDKRKAFLAETVKAFAPDLLGTQETLAFQRDFLTEQLPGHGAFAAGRDDGKEAGEMAALYWRRDRFEKTDGGHFWLSDRPDTAGSKGWDAALPRVATWVKLRDRAVPNAKPVLFLNVHFDHRGTKARAESAKLLREKLTALGAGCSVVVTGDFNADEGSEPYRALFGKQGDAESPVVDTFRVMHPIRAAGEGTFSGFRAGQTGGPRIDWIGGSRDWTVRSAAIDRTVRDGRTPSDHFPVTAVLRRSVGG